MSKLKIALKIARYIPFIHKYVNRFATDYLCKVIPGRPRAFSLWSHIPKPPEPPSLSYDEQGPIGEYTTWPMLTDKKFSARHLPPAEKTYIDSLPEDTEFNPQAEKQGDVTSLFLRRGEMTKDRSSMLFMFFAQWFTDSVLRINPLDRRQNTSNHNIDLCQIYGLTEAAANVLRSHEGGRLRSQIINGEEFLDYLCEQNGNGKVQIKDHYHDLPYVQKGLAELLFKNLPDERKLKLYATGLERGNSSIGYVAVSTLFMREHNRICGELKKRNPDWDDERLFQTARLINMAILMKLTIVDYINHIAGNRLFVFDTRFAEKKSWYRLPWIALEFDLLYRWHGLIPDSMKVDDTVVSQTDYRFNNGLLEQIGLSKAIHASATQNAGKIGLQNSPKWILGAEYAMIRMGRDFRLKPYNEYRKLFNLSPICSFQELTDDRELADKLESLYGHIDKLEFTVGLFAEKKNCDQLFGDLLNAMVSYDAFTQIYTNPLLSKNVYHARTLTQYGLDLIDATQSVQDLASRNLQNPEGIIAKFSM